MFRPKRKQKTILDHDIYLPEDRQKALEKSWAGPFRKTVLPMIQEEPFRPFYCPDNGRPNVPVAILTGCPKRVWNFRYKVDYERALFAMTANRLCEPDSKLRVWDRWLSKVYLPSCRHLKLDQMYEAPPVSI